MWPSIVSAGRAESKYRRAAASSPPHLLPPPRTSSSACRGSTHSRLLFDFSQPSAPFSHRHLHGLSPRRSWPIAAPEVPRHGYVVRPPAHAGPPIGAMPGRRALGLSPIVFLAPAPHPFPPPLPYQQQTLRYTQTNTKTVEGVIKDIGQI